MFPLASNWLGADVATSIKLNQTDYLWLFGDTAQGELVDGDRKRKIEGYARNSIAIQRGDGPVQYFTTVPDNQCQCLGFFNPPWGGQNSWLWVVSGAMLGDVLHLFGAQVVHGSGEKRAFNFHAVGSVHLSIPSANKLHPREWESTAIYSNVSHTNGTRTFNTAATLFDGKIYILGAMNEGVFANYAVMSRFDGHQTEYLNESGEWGQFQGWEKLKVLFNGVPPETTITHLESANRFYLLFNPFLGEMFYIRTAEHVWGPWDEPRPLFNVTFPPFNDKKNVFLYALKSHPQLRRNSDIVFSFMSNDRNGPEFKENNIQIYVPKFVSVNITL